MTMPASIGGGGLTELPLEEAERLVSALNALELRYANLARRRVLDDLRMAWQALQGRPPHSPPQPLGQEPRTCGTACGASRPDGMHCPPLQR
ncbi:MAG: hypothetical protein K0S06_3401 [Microvirga sp.]|nr:hypothetical protein [Microvirga sp.]